MNLKNNKN